jgi:hypothetical protein
LSESTIRRSDWNIAWELSGEEGTSMLPVIPDGAWSFRRLPEQVNDRHIPRLREAKVARQTVDFPFWPVLSALTFDSI